MRKRSRKKGDAKTPRRPARQYGALPFRHAPGLEILLLTSRETKRWVIPKGWPMRGLTPPASAATEATEEAGITGAIGASSIGRYLYGKRAKDGSERPCEVTVFPMDVFELAETWVEQAQRERRWFPAKEAARQIQEPGLAALIKRFARHND